MSYLYSHTKIVKIKKSDSSELGKDVEQPELSDVLVGGNGTNTLGEKLRRGKEIYGDRNKNNDWLCSGEIDLKGT